MPEQVAYLFQEGPADKFISRGTFIAWMLVPHVFFTLLAFILVRLVLLGSRYRPEENPLTQKILPVMGNMVALPQVILTFALLQIFLYNAYHIQIIPIWVFAIIIMIAGGIVLGVFFLQSIRQAHRERARNPQE
jgi:magnesium-transporting ATPase (P-type)